MMDDLDVSSSEYSMVLVVFFISYVIFEVPSNLVLVRAQPSIFLPTIMVVWGAVTMCMAAVKSYGALLGLRFVLGMVEAGFAPGVMFLLSSWYKPDEQAKRFSIFYSAAVLSGAFGGIVAGAITGSLDGARGLRGWQWLFVRLRPLGNNEAQTLTKPKRLACRGCRNNSLCDCRIFRPPRLSRNHKALFSA